MISLGIHKAPADTRVVVAMSGGVDSSVAAALLAHDGYQVIGVTLQLYDHGAAVGRKGACCAGQDIHDARRVADRLEIPHYVLDYEARFRAEVMDDFAETYLRGETPIPCVRCNERVKFRDLLETARDLGADALATGHYGRRRLGPDGPELHRAREAARDQSYFLFATTRDQLEVLRFPLGGRPKAETRAIAKRLGLGVADKPDSQDICFVPHGRYAELIARLSSAGCDVAVTGSAFEVELVERVIKNSGVNTQVYLGSGGLKELAGVLAGLDVFIGPSTGPLHLASAVGTPVVGIYCPIFVCLPARWGPIGPNDTALTPDVAPCNRCINGKCDHFDCMESINVDEVKDAALGKVRALADA